MDEDGFKINVIGNIIEVIFISMHSLMPLKMELLCHLRKIFLILVSVLK